MGAEVVGISSDSHFTHRAFAQKLGLHFPLLSDFERETASSYVGFFDDVVGYRRVGRRGVVIVDQSSVVRWTWFADVPTDIPDGEEVRQALQDVVYG